MTSTPLNTLCRELGVHPLNVKDFLSRHGLSVTKEVIPVSIVDDPEPEIEKFTECKNVHHWCDGCGVGVIGTPLAVSCDFCDTDFTLCTACEELTLPDHECD